MGRLEKNASTMTTKISFQIFPDCTSGEQSFQDLLIFYTSKLKIYEFIYYSHNTFQNERQTWERLLSSSARNQFTLRLVFTFSFRDISFQVHHHVLRKGLRL